MISKSVCSTLASIIEHTKPKTTLGKHKTFLFKGKLKTNWLQPLRNFFFK